MRAFGEVEAKAPRKAPWNAVLCRNALVAFRCPTPDSVEGQLKEK